MKSLQEIRKIDKESTTKVYKYHWGKAIHRTPTDDGAPKPTIEMLVQLKRNGVKGCWFTPCNKWVSINWLRKNDYNAIAERILFLISSFGDSKRYLVYQRNANGNLMLTYIPLDWINEYV